MTASVTPTSTLALTIDAIRDLIANSETWQTWVGATTAAAAKLSTHLINDDQFHHPLVIVSQAVGYEVSDYLQRGQFNLLFEARNDGGYVNDDDAVLDFLNKVGAVVEEAKIYDEANSRITTKPITLLQPVERTRDEAGQDYLTMKWQIDCGIDD